MKDYYLAVGIISALLAGTASLTAFSATWSGDSPDDLAFAERYEGALGQAQFASLARLGGKAIVWR